MNKSIEEAARRIFGNLPYSTCRTGNKVLRKNSFGHKLVAYYPQGKIPGTIEHVADKAIPNLDMDEKKEWLRWKREDNATKGVFPVKKGQGKRAGLRK